jgi:uncharacterized membrane protein
MIEFLGHFHPVVVHLPIGFLLVGLLLQWLSRKEKYASIKPAVAIVLLWGTIAANIACVTGYLLSISDDYDKKLVTWHMWVAIGVVLTSAVLYTKEINPKVEINKKMLSVWLLILIMFTGHLGGSLTHGSDYLTRPFVSLFNDDSISSQTIKPLANVQEAIAYNDVIQPILQTKCYSCHNSNKQKGGLRMDDINLLMKGGKNGKVIDLSIADSSEMLQRLLLPVDNEDHMPPKEKPQPTENQVSLLKWWIGNHADFKKKVKELDQPEKIKPLLLALQQPVIIKKEKIDVPAEAVAKADEKIIEQLKQSGAMVIPVAQISNYLSVNFENDTSVSKKDMVLLEKLKKQLIWLKASDKMIANDALPELSKLTNLRRLNLANTNITDNTLQQLQSLDKLQYLNLVGTGITTKGILALKNIKTMQSLYLYQTKVSANDAKMLTNTFPKTMIDFGNYVVPFLVSDTTLVKAEKTY